MCLSGSERSRGGTEVEGMIVLRDMCEMEWAARLAIPICMIDLITSHHQHHTT
jgi:hypothetical protein